MKEIIMRPAMKAVIEYNGKILLLREAKYDESSKAGLYHFPGGRVNPGEHFLDCLKREVREETGLEVEILRPIFVGEWRPEIKGVINHIIATFFHCRALSSDVKLSEEHDDFIWIEPKDYIKHKLAEPDDQVVETFIKLAS